MQFEIRMCNDSSSYASPAQNTFASCRSLWFIINFQIFSSISIENLSGILREIMLNLQITWVVMALLNFFINVY